MSLRTKILIGVLLVSVVLMAALIGLGYDASQRLQQASEDQSKALNDAMVEYRKEQRAKAVLAIEELVIAQLKEMLTAPETEIPGRLGNPDNGLPETAIITKRESGLEYNHYKPAGSKATAGEDERAVMEEVFNSRQRRFYGDVLFYPYPIADVDPPGKSSRVIRLKLNIPPMPEPAIPRVASPNLTPLALIAIITLAVTMIGVFMLLTVALRRFVLGPLGDVLEDSQKIVKGKAGLEVKGLSGKGGDEVETLVAAFNAMFAELKDYQQDLEGKVKDATRTIQKQQQSLVIAQRLAATGTLAAGLAHEVNNPLSGMINAARRLRLREGLDERARDYVGLIEEGLGRIEELMKQILDFSRRRDMKPERFDAPVPLKRCLPLVKHRLEKRKIQLEEDVHNDLTQAFGNVEELGQVLMNLVINAIDAAPEGGTVRVTVARSAKDGTDYIVEDSGSGVPDEIKDRIFDPFFTTKEPGKGTGLGLAIVHTIIDNHGGVVRVEKSERLGGAKFVVTLPPAEKQESRRIDRAAV